MRLARIVLIATLLLPAIGFAQVPSCPECVLGIYDNPSLSQSWGTISILEPKEVYVGMKMSGDLQEFTGVEFSIAGLNDGVVLMGAIPIGSRPLVFGTLPAPPDTTVDSSGEGGVTAVWGANACRRSNEALFKLVLFTGEQISNKILTIKRSYPPTNFTWHAAVLTQCDAPSYTATTISGGCYILNPDGPADCVVPNRVAVTAANWTTVKNLYR